MSYSEETGRLLEAAGATEGAMVVLEAAGRSYRGRLMPHHEFSGPDIVILKMKSGYNVGIRVDGSSRIAVEEQPSEAARREEDVQSKEGLPTLSLIGTGGTIASYVDYRTGAVHPALSTSDMVNAIPEIREVANIRAKVLFSIFSENMGPEHWQKLAECVRDEIESGADGVIIPHGTDTMGYTAAALSFMLPDVPKPVVLVGAQRSSDRPSSDASTNLMACARFCTESGKAGVFVIMHDTQGDDSFAVHTGTRVRKMHTSRRDAFRSINAPVAAHVDASGKVEVLEDLRDSSDAPVRVEPAMEDGVLLLQYYPGMDPEAFRPLIMSSKGVVFAGSGLGHVNSSFVPMLREACAKGIVVAMTSQCLNGRVNMNVYDTGRDLLAAGVVPLLDMLPETAYIKLRWALANTSSPEEARKVMVTPLAGEMGDRREF